MIRIPRHPLAAGLAATLVLTGCGGVPSTSVPNPDPTATATAPTSLPEDEAGLRAVLAANPWNAPALSRLSKIFWDEGRYQEGVDLLESARTSAMRFPDELLAALALHHDALGDTEIAAQLTATLESRVHDWSRDGSAVTFLRLRGDSFATAEDVAERAVKANGSAPNWNNLGIALLYAGKPEAARDAFLKARDKDSTLPGPLYNLAIVDRFYRFDDDGARDWFRKYRSLSSEDPDGLAALLDVKVAAGSAGAATTEVTP